ncbi:MAG: hypothetical protein AB7P76_00405 [Candidatus Melainabacteria bacterium]
MGFSAAGLNVNYALKLYPTYRGGPVVNASRSNAIGADDSFTVQATAYSNGYEVGVQPDTVPFSDNTYLTFSRSGGLSSQPVSQASDLNGFLSLSGQGTGVSSASLPGVNPGYPAQYLDFLRSLALSEFNVADYLTPNNTFQLPGVGIGVEYTTDALGNIDSHRLNPNTLTQLQGNLPGATGADFALMNRYKALISLLKALPGNSDAGAVPPGIKARLAQLLGIDALSDAGLNNLLGFLKKSAGLTPLRPGGNTPLPLAAGADTADNPVLVRLRALQTTRLNDTGVALTSSAAETTTARQAAAVRAGLNVRLGEDFQENIAQLTRQHLTQGGVYAQSQTVMQAMQHLMPMVPTLPNASELRGNAEPGGNGLGPSGDMMDSSGRRSSGGYLGFSLGTSGGSSGGASGGGSGGAAGGFSGGFSGGSSSGGNPFSPPRQRFSMVG